jgi:2-polyprenyl-3-methyl-5-hydroxy-6-metoxy-1,4-benzoquinol methylase
LIPDAYFDRFETLKYRTKNPLQRLLIRRFVAALHDLFIEANPVATVLEIGVGEGFLSGYLSEKFVEKRFTGVDPRPGDLARVKQLFPRIETLYGSAYDLGALEGPYDLVLCAEVLEHLHEPGRALAEMLRLRPRRLLLTVPHEPYFRLSNLFRGKNVTRLGNDPEHVNHWGRGSFRRLLEGPFEVLRLTASYPWLLALASPR